MKEFNEVINADLIFDEEVETVSVDPSELDGQILSSSTTATDKVRFQTELIANWTGVKSCGQQRRIASNIIRVRDQWIRKVEAQNPNLTRSNYGFIHPVKAIIRKRRSRWSGKRSCWGRCQFRCYVEFKRPTNDPA